MNEQSIEHRIKFLENRMNNFIKVFNEMPAKDYPWSAMILSFGYAHIMNQQEMAGRIKELSELLNYRFIIQTKEKNGKLIPYIEVNKNGSTR